GRAGGKGTSGEGKNPTGWGGSRSVGITSSSPSRFLMVARPAARRLRTQLTSPQGAQTQRLPEISRTATAVVRGRPLFRPRMVTSRLKPSGTPAAKRNSRIGLKNLTRRGTPAALTTRSPIFLAPSYVDSFGLPHR